MSESIFKSPECYIKDKKMHILVPGGCKKCPEHHATYDIVYVGLNKDIDLDVRISEEQHSGCTKLICGEKILSLKVEVPINILKCIIHEHYFEVCGEMKSTRNILFGRYRHDFIMKQIKES